MTQLTVEQKQEVMNAVECLYGDERGALLSALEDLISEAGAQPVKKFLLENIQDMTSEDFMDPGAYAKIKKLIAEL